MPNFDVVASVIFTALQVAIVIIMIYRREYRRYRWFFVYTGYSVAITAARLSLLSSPVLYFVTGSIGEILYSLFALLAIIEVFKAKLQLIYEKRPLTRYLLWPGTFLVVTAIALWRAIYHPFGTSFLAHLTPGAWGFVICARALESSLYIAGWALQKGGRLALDDRPFKILKGFGLAAFFSLLAYLVRYHFGPTLETVFRYLPLGAYLGSTWLWLQAFLQPEPPNTVPAPELKKVQSLLDLLGEEKKTFRKLKNQFNQA